MLFETKECTRGKEIAPALEMGICGFKAWL